MSILIKKLLIKAVEKTAKFNPSDTFTQMNVDDVVHILKSIIF